jgi:hypothetical protein
MLPGLQQRPEAANPNPRPGGPENSLNLWGDQDFDHEQEILCDYGAAYSFLLWLADTYGDGVLTTLHNDSALQGFDSVQAVLDDVDPGRTVGQAIDVWQATTALDDGAGRRRHVQWNVCTPRSTGRLAPRTTTPMTRPGRRRTAVTSSA